MMTQEQLRERIDTIVVVMMENRSFDHIFGHLGLPGYGERKDLRALADLQNLDYGNASQNGTLIQPFVSQDQPFASDLPHARGEVATQIAASPDGRATMSGFVRAYEQHTHTSGLLRPPSMGILTPRDLPMTSFLGQEYRICDSWFASLPTSTAPNRLMAMCGYTMIDETGTFVPDQHTVYDWLEERKKRWRVYHAGLPFLTLMKNTWHYMVTSHFQRLSQLAHDVQNEPSNSWPEVIFVEPDYQDSPVHLSGQACDNHPPLPMAFGEAFLRQVYEALTSNPARWQRTVMILAYDEHGGFFDHEVPRNIPGPPPVGATYPPFTSTGIRIPAVVVSPLVTAGSVAADLFDHTSILQLLAERFGEAGELYSTEVEQRRQAGIVSLSAALDAQPRPGAVPPAPSQPFRGTALLESASEPVSALGRAFAQQIEAFAKTVDAEGAKKFPEIAHWMGTP
jgi:phospholipase C